MKDNYNGLVSVIIPTYNRANSIVSCIDSVLNQTVSPLEIIVVDDGSTDGTETLVKNIKSDKIIYLRQVNSGACIARNVGIALAKGKYLAFQDSDDIWFSQKLETELDLLINNNADIVSCSMKCIENDVEYHKNVFSKLPNGFFDAEKSHIGCSTQTLVMKSLIAKQIPFDLEMPRLQDFEFLIRVRNAGYKFYFIHEDLVEYHNQGDNISSNPMKLYKAADLLAKKYFDKFSQIPYLKKEISTFYTIAAKQLYTKKKKEYLNCLKSLKRFDHSMKNSLKLFLATLHLFWICL